MGLQLSFAQSENCLDGKRVQEEAPEIDARIALNVACFSTMAGGTRQKGTDLVCYCWEPKQDEILYRGAHESILRKLEAKGHMAGNLSLLLELI